MKKSLLFLFVVLVTNSVFAKIWTPSILSDGMVLQQNSVSTIWGWTTNTNEEITVFGSWNSDVKITTRAQQGFWSIELPTPAAGGGPFKLVIAGHDTLVFTNVLIGEVWFCSGQSNMQWSLARGVKNAQQEIENANYSGIRFFQIDKRQSFSPQDDNPGKWQPCTPESIKDFSALAYFFGRELHNKLSVPVGVINSSWGGTSIAVWMPEDLYKNDKALTEAQKQIAYNKWSPTTPGAAFNSMVHPFTRFNIAGVIWYQGESDAKIANSYYRSFPMLIQSWREKWQKYLPFYFVQIAPYKYADDTTHIHAAIVRDAQLQTMKSVPNTGMVVINDIGEVNNIHPKNKQEVGRRLARWAFAKNYGFKNLVYSGPGYKSAEIDKNKIIIHFDFADGGLIKKGKTLTEFQIAGADKKFYPAKAIIVGNMVEVSNSKIENPVAVRFAFSNAALPNLFNRVGLPASAFRTDNWETAEDAKLLF